jgi:anaerobic selenocysteine-containing dehydrogenase
LADGDTVRISTATGSIRLPVQATDSVQPGTISVTHGFEDVNVNGLIDRHDLDLLTGMARLSAVPVTIARA